MGNNKRILFIPGIPYLADPQFLAILPHLKEKGYELVYLYTGDSYSALMGKGDKKDAELLKEQFDAYDETESFYGYPELGQAGQIEKIKRFSRYIKGVRKKLDQYRPDCIISCSDMGISQRTAIQWAKKKKIPFIILQAAFFETDGSSYNFGLKIKYFIFNQLLKIPIFRRGKIPGNEYNHTYLLLWGNFFRQFFSKDNVHVTGNSKLDYLINMSNDELKKNKSVLICTEDNKNLSKLIGETKVSYILNMWKYIVENNRDINFIIRPHPTEDMELISSLFSEYPNVEIDNKTELFEQFKTAYCQISYNSASSFEAVAAKVPIILCIPKDLSQNNVFFNEEIALTAEDSTELEIQLKKVLEKEFYEEFLRKRKKYLENRIGYLDGKSSERTASRITSIINC